jgi:hypothetical protein
MLWSNPHNVQRAKHGALAALLMLVSLAWWREGK